MEAASSMVSALGLDGLEAFRAVEVLRALHHAETLTVQ
jgi:hypothetical protein